MPNIQVKCTVENCFFHAVGNICGAEKIEIHTDSVAQKEEFGADFDLASEQAAHSKYTCCKTFISKRQKETTD